MCPFSLELKTDPQQLLQTGVAAVQQLGQLLASYAEQQLASAVLASHHKLFHHLILAYTLAVQELAPLGWARPSRYPH
jgi:hypothetical protein